MKILRKIINKFDKSLNWFKIKFLNYSQFDFIIGPEIKNDFFYSAIYHISMDIRFKNFLEIGSSSGQGSTSAFVAGMNSRSDQSAIKLICLELSNKRFERLKHYYNKIPFIKIYNLSSVGVSKFPPLADVENFYINRKTNLNDTPFEEVKEWYEADIRYILESGKDIDGIESIKRRLSITHFDVVLIDGSEFTGNAELDSVLGADVILLDDTESYKCREAFERLMINSSYNLQMHEPGLRGGFAIFSKQDISDILKTIS